MTLLIYFEAQH